jgi:cytochrome c oxidase cbb3-type subunit III
MMLSIQAARRLRCGLTAMAITVVIAVCPTRCAAQSRALTDASPADVLAGKEVFDAQCALCHGTGGAGGTGPDLRRPRLLHAVNDEELISVIRNGIPGTPMPFTFLSLSDPVIWQTAAYVRTLGRVEREPVKGSSQRGAALYAGNKCGECHTIAGTGGILGPDLSLIGVQRGTASLRQSLLDPGAEHALNYGVVRATLEAGGEIRGIRLDEDVFWILLREASGRVTTLSKKALVQIEREKNGTLMPSYQSLSATDLDDLVAYLATLGGER